MNIAQLRGTIFAPLNIVYTPENFTKFGELLLPGSTAYNAIPPEMMYPGLNPNQPQYGLPWRLFKKEKEEDYNIVFLPGKVDIILTKDIAYSEGTEEMFCKKCIEWFSKILATQAQIKVNRIAYAPLYAIKLTNDVNAESIWDDFLKRTVIDGTPIEDVNYNFRIKRKVSFKELSIQMNFVHNFSDALQIKGNEKQRVMLLQLDMNSIPEEPLALDAIGVNNFFNGILEEKKKLIEYVCE